MHKPTLMAAVFPCLLGFSVVAAAADDEHWPPRNNGFTFAAVMGPEAIGAGPGYAAWDVGKPGRDMYLYTVFADTDYRTYMLTWREPGLLKPGERLDLTAYYQKRTGTHFFGIGPDRELEDGAYYQRENYLFGADYTLPLAGGFGITLSAFYDRVAPGKSTLRDREAFLEEYDELDRPIELVYPELLDSREWRDEHNHFRGVELWFDTLEGPEKFRTGGVRLSGRVERVDEWQGAEWNYWRYNASGCFFAPLGEDDYNIAHARLRWDRLDGDELPFYKLPALGQARFSTGYILDHNAMRGVWENLYADRNRAIGSIELRHRVKANWYPDSWRKVDWPFDFDPEKFIRNMAWTAWTDAGQVWPDGEAPEGVVSACGIGNIIYFDTGMAQHVTVGFSEDMVMYMVFAYHLGPGH